MVGKPLLVIFRNNSNFLYSGKSFSKTITAILTSVKMREEGKQHGKNPHGVSASLPNPLGRPGFPGSGGVGNSMSANQR